MHELNQIPHLNGNIKRIRARLEHDQASDAAVVKELSPSNNISNLAPYHFTLLLIRLQIIF